MFNTPSSRCSFKLDESDRVSNVLRASRGALVNGQILGVNERNHDSTYVDLNP